jgi:autotransporter-associated beta strand protein
VNFSGGNTFYNLDAVTFDNSATQRTATIPAAIEPRLVTVDHSGNPYTFNGTGSLAGAAKLVKSGTGTLVIANSAANTFTGGTTLNAGTLSLSNTNTPLGTGTITMNGGTLQLPSAIFLSNSMVFSGSSAIASTGGNSALLDSTTGTITSSGNASVDLSGVTNILSINGAMSGFTGTFSLGASSAMIRLSAGGTAMNFGSASAHFDLGTAGAMLNNRNGNITIQLGALSGGPNTKLYGRQTGSGATTSTYVVGALNANTTFAGSISNAGDLSGLNLVKVGTGTWTLSGNSNYVGSLGIDAGNLTLSGSLACTAGADVNHTASLTLAGGTLTVNSLEIAPGASFNGNGTIAGELVNHGTITSTSGTLVVTGSVKNNGTMRLKNGSQLVASGPFQNYGILDLLTASGGLPPNLENFGVVIDSSGLEVVSSGIQGVDFKLTIATFNGHVYQFEHSETMAPGSWTTIGAPVDGDGSEKTFTHTAGVSGTKRFYRVAVDP